MAVPLKKIPHTQELLDTLYMVHPTPTESFATLYKPRLHSVPFHVMSLGHGMQYPHSGPTAVYSPLRQSESRTASQTNRREIA